MSKPDGRPAFSKPNNSDRAYGGNDGMSLRDYFAAKTMLGFLADHLNEAPNGLRGLAEFAYEIADAMLEEREKT